MFLKLGQGLFYCIFGLRPLVGESVNGPRLKKKSELFLSSKMGRGVLAVAGGSGGKPIFGVFGIVLSHFGIVLNHF